MSASYKDYGYQSAELGWAHAYLFPQLRAMLGQPLGPILDMGCGNGSVARALIAQGYDVYGVDASESGIAIANAEAPGRFFVLDVSSGQLPAELAGKRFDGVISTEVIEHLYDPRGFIAFARRILQSGGGGASSSCQRRTTAMSRTWPWLWPASSMTTSPRSGTAGTSSSSRAIRWSRCCVSRVSR